MKKLLRITCLICFNILSIFVALGQPKPVPVQKNDGKKCDCDVNVKFTENNNNIHFIDFSNSGRINSNPKTKSFYDPNLAIDNITSFVDIYNNDVKRSLKFSGKVYLTKDNCADRHGGAVVGRYNEKTDVFCLVFMNSFFDDLVKNQGDLFVLAHEVGHLVCRHIHDDPQNKIRFDVLSQVIKNIPGVDAENLKKIQNYSAEHEADLMGVWLLLKKGLDSKDILNIFAKVAKEFKNNDGDTPNSPSFTTRRRFIETYLKNSLKASPTRKGIYEDIDEVIQTDYPKILTELFRNKQSKDSLTVSEIAISEALSKLYDKSIQKIKKGDIANNAGKYCDALSTYQEIDSTLMILYPNSQIYKDNKEKINTIKAILQKPSNWNVELLGGGILSFPMLYSNNILVPTQGYNTPTLGLRLSQYSWYKKSRVEIDFRYTSLRFDTYSDKDVIKKAIERFDLTQLSISPHLVYSSTGSKNDTLCASRFGFLMSFGFSANYILKTKYTNFYTNESPLLKTGISPGVYIGIGGERLERKMKNTYIRAMITFQAQNLPFKTETSLNQNYSAWSYQVGAELSIRFWKL